VQPAHYGRGNRCVLRYLVSEAGGERYAVIGKVVADGSGANAYRVLMALAARADERRTTPLQVPAPIGYRHDLGLVLLESVPGAALCSSRVKAYLRRESAPSQHAADEIATCARIAAALHSSPIDAAPRHLNDDLHALHRSAVALRARSPGLGSRLLERLQGVRERLGQSTPLAPVLCHGDFKLNQIIGDGACRTLIDLDTACLAEPARDLGQFLL